MRSPGGPGEGTLRVSATQRAQAEEHRASRGLVFREPKAFSANQQLLCSRSSSQSFYVHKVIFRKRYLGRGAHMAVSAVQRQQRNCAHMSIYWCVCVCVYVCRFACKKVSYAL